MYRTEFTIPLAFKAARRVMDDDRMPLERVLRKEAAAEFRRFKLIPKMIDRTKELLNVNDDSGNPKR